MSGHSKWANIKHKKAKEDAKRGKIFTKIARQITSAAREGGGDPDSNFKLRIAIDKAKSVNMPGENIERAIARGIGGVEGDNYEEVTYEGYGPGGVAILVQAMTDNRNRTASDLRYTFSKNGGNLGEAGCVAWMFEKKGLIIVERGEDSAIDEDALMMAALEGGAEDVKTEEDSVEIVTAPEDLEAVENGLKAAGFQPASAEVTMLPQNTIEVEGDAARRVVRLIDALEDLDDVQEVYTNADLSDDAFDDE